LEDEMKTSSKVHKRALSLLLTLLMVFSIGVPSYARQVDAGVYELPADVNYYKSSAVETTSGASLEADTVFETSEVFELPPADPRQRASGANIGVRVYGTYRYNTSRREHVFSLRVSREGVGSAPVLRRAELIIARADTKNGTYRVVTSYPWDELIRYDHDYSISIPAGTGHYMAIHRVDTLINNQAPNGIAATSYACINRTGHMWQFNYTDRVSGKRIEEPPTNYVKHARYGRPSTLRTFYFNWYRNTFGISLPESASIFEIHHIRPLEFGGDNTASNLIHLSPHSHRAITGWFAGY